LAEPHIRREGEGMEDAMATQTVSRVAGGEAAVIGKLNYSLRSADRPRYHANDTTRDVLHLDTRETVIHNGRLLPVAPTLEAEGFKLVRATTAVTDFRDDRQTGGIYAEEVRDIVQRESGADKVVITGPGVLRFAEKSTESGERSNSRPARFIHNDVSGPTARAMAARVLGGEAELANYRGFTLFNLWRTFSAPPQDVPLAMLDGRTLDAGDLIAADAVFDERDKPEWSFEGFLVHHDPRQRWVYFPDMDAGEALLFTTFTYRDGQPFCVPHSGFDDPTCPADAGPRASIEMRAIAFFR